MSKIKHNPGVYIEEQSHQSAIVMVETSVPAFIGYTEKAGSSDNPLHMKPTRISSMEEFVKLFGTDHPVDVVKVELDEHRNLADIGLDNTVRYLLYDSLRLFYANGGGDCHIVSVGLYGTAPVYGDEFSFPPTGLRGGVKVLESYNEPTLILFPDAVNVVNNGNDDPQFYHLQQLALQQCGSLRDRMAIFDLKENISGDHNLIIENFRNQIGSNELKYGAAYSPWLTTSFSREITINSFRGNITGKDGELLSLYELSAEPAHLELITSYEEATDDISGKLAKKDLYENHPVIKDIINQIKVKLNTIPPSGAVAGIYNKVDTTRGVWKAPANVSIDRVTSPSVAIDNKEQEKMNVDPHGKSINAIRHFTGRGIMVWGARTLAGNNHEWKYINVRRLIMMVEESCNKAMENFIEEPNDRNTWIRVKNLTENFLLNLWRQGAITGSQPNDAFFVKVGLNETMTEVDIEQNRMIIMIGLAPMRPAEFTVLRINVDMQNT